MPQWLSWGQSEANREFMGSCRYNFEELKAFCKSVTKDEYLLVDQIKKKKKWVIEETGHLLWAGCPSDKDKNFYWKK